MIEVMSTKYVCRIRFDHHLPDENAWRAKLLEFGFQRDDFNVRSYLNGVTVLIFQEPDRAEALRILDQFNEMCDRPL